jgi:hypothetical protein
VTNTGTHDVNKHPCDRSIASTNGSGASTITGGPVASLAGATTTAGGVYTLTQAEHQYGSRSNQATAGTPPSGADVTGSIG